MRTTLNLLTRDGLVYMSFSPHLTPKQYGELIDIVDHGTTADEMRQAVKRWADLLGLRVEFNEATSA